MPPVSGEVLTSTYTGRTTKNWIAFLEQVEGWLPPDVERVYAILDNLNVHRSWDVLRFNVVFPRWEFVFQPKYAAYLNLIEPMRARRYVRWLSRDDVLRPGSRWKKASAYWNAHKHPFVWGRRRRHRPRRHPGIAVLSKVS
ncbi:MAG TPA: transposase [Ktedonobacteraceae bacterium]|nr:transposase [Ktedonobacteraceae bacterium]